ncbi:peptidylprolyl isomerase [Psychrobacillus sp. L3]|uniref:peptidylprolyl isomerase n=1 Tax=Psychrobacillus sp. L3 TaxID=3236891 RepID=UPI0036F32753
MKKLFCLTLFLTLVLAGCNSSELSISEIQSVPNKVQEGINSDYTLQLINEGENNAYILFQSKGTVTAELEVKDNILNIKLDNANQENNELKQYVYKLTRGKAEYDSILVLVNGQTMPFDNVTGFN